MSAPPQFSYLRRVQFSDTDMAGIVHFANFYYYMEECEHEYFRSLGLSISTTGPDGVTIGWPRVRASCGFESPARYDELVEVRLYVARKGVKSLTFDFEFWRDKTRLARGTLKTVCCRFHPDRPIESIEIPPEFADKFVESAYRPDKSPSSRED